MDVLTRLFCCWGGGGLLWLVFSVRDVLLWHICNKDICGLFLWEMYFCCMILWGQGVCFVCERCTFVAFLRYVYLWCFAVGDVLFCAMWWGQGVCFVCERFFCGIFAICTSVVFCSGRCTFLVWCCGVRGYTFLCERCTFVVWCHGGWVCTFMTWCSQGVFVYAVPLKWCIFVVFQEMDLFFWWCFYGYCNVLLEGFTCNVSGIFFLGGRGETSVLLLWQCVDGRMYFYDMLSSDGAGLLPSALPELPRLAPINSPPRIRNSKCR